MSPFTITDDFFSVPLDASAAPVELSRSAAGDLLEPPVPTGTRAIFFAHRAAEPGEVASANELQSAPTVGDTDPVRLHPELALGPSARDVYSFQHSPDGRWVVYRADQDVDGVVELYAVRSDGNSAPFKLNAPTNGLPILASTISPDSVHAVYHSQADARLYRTTLDGSSAPLALTPPGASPSSQFTADSQTLVYHLSSRAYAVAVDGTGSPVELLGTLVGGGGLPGSTLPLACTSPDSARFYFVADKDTNDQFELYGVPLDGSAAPTKLSGTMVASGDVLWTNNVYFRISPDGSRLVFVADKDVDEVAEVYGVPADGSAAPVELSGAMTAGGDASPIAHGLAISPDSARVVYLADQLVDERFELFTAPLDGSKPAVRINGTLVAGGDVVSLSGTMPFVISPDSTRVVYRADQDTNDRFELYVAPLDGSGPSTKLNGPMSPGGYVVRFALNGDGAHVLYSTSGPVDQNPMLFIVPLDGSAAPVDLSGPRGVTSFLPSPDGTGVAYVAAFPAGPYSGLYWVRSDGARTLMLGSYPSEEYAFHPAATRIVHRSNLQGRQELWLRYVQRVPRPRGF